MPVNPAKDMRFGERRPYDGTIQISWQERSGESRLIRAKCLDLSDEGACIESVQPIQARTSVYLRASSFGVMGNATVRYCRRRGTKHIIGLMFSAAVSLADKGRKRCLTESEPGVENEQL